MLSRISSLLFFFSYSIALRSLFCVGTGFALNPTSIRYTSGSCLGFGLVKLNYLGTVVFLGPLSISSMLCIVPVIPRSAFLPVAASDTLARSSIDFYFWFAKYGIIFPSM